MGIGCNLVQSLSLNTQFKVVGWATAVGCILLGATLITYSFEAYQRYQVGSRELARFHLALLAANAISAERGPANSVMGANSEQMPALAAALGTKRGLTNQSLDVLAASFREELSRPGEQAEIARQVRSQLNKGREAVDIIAALPIDQRGDRQLRDAIEELFKAADVAAILRDDLGHTIAKTYPQISTEIILSTISSSMREQAGRLGSYVVMVLASSAPLNNDLYSKLASTEGRLTELRALASTYGGSVLGSAAVEQALTDVDNAYFRGALPFARDVAQSAATTSGQMSLTDFTQKYVPGMKAVEILRELVSTASQQRIAGARDSARNVLITSMLMTLIVCVVLIFVRAASRRLLFLPLMQAKKQIVAIAQGDLAEPAICRNAGREMREVFNGLEVLREQQRRRRILERNQERIATRLKRLSETDGLTGLLNRRALETLGSKAVAEAERGGQPLAVIMFDIDHFKSINDTYGHGIGDTVLKNAVDLIQARLRPGDQLARLGGEEFVILVADGHEKRVRLVAERIRTVLARTSVCRDPRVVITASFGVAVHQRGEGDWNELIARADQRLYAAKRSGRNRVCADHDGHEEFLKSA